MSCLARSVGVDAKGKRLLLRNCKLQYGYDKRVEGTIHLTTGSHRVNHNLTNSQIATPSCNAGHFSELVYLYCKRILSKLEANFLDTSRWATRSDEGTIQARARQPGRDRCVHVRQLFSVMQADRYPGHATASSHVLHATNHH